MNTPNCWATTNFRLERLPSGEYDTAVFCMFHREWMSIEQPVRITVKVQS